MFTAIKTTEDNMIYRRSRWIQIKHNYNPNKHNSLWYYVNDGNGCREGEKNYNPENGLYLDYFTWNGRNYALNQFLRLDNPIMYYDKEGKLNYLSGYDSENYYNPILIELDECCEYVRVYEE